MPKLYNQASGELISEITAAQLQFLVDHLEEEHTKDQDYFINLDTLNMLREAAGDPELLSRIEDAMDDKGEVDIMWK